MSRKGNTKTEMFQPTTERVNSLTIDDVAGQAVPESGTGRTECSVADSCKLHSRYLQSMCPRWSEPMPARHVVDADKVVDQVAYCGANPYNDLKINISSFSCMRSYAHAAQPVKDGACLSDVVWAQKTGDGFGSGVEHRLGVTIQGI